MPKGMQCDVCEKFSARSSGWVSIVQGPIGSLVPDFVTEATLCSATCLEEYAAAKVEAEIAAKAKADAKDAETEAARVEKIEAIERSKAQRDKELADMRHHPQKASQPITNNFYISGDSDPKAVAEQIMRRQARQAE